MEKRTSSPRPKNRQTGAKILITALSISFTLGAWQSLAREAAKTANLENSAGQPAQVSLEAAPLIAAPLVTAPLVTAPLPTLIPSLPGQTNSGSAGLSSSQPPERLFMGGAKPQTQRPAPVARTGSSR